MGQKNSHTINVLYVFGFKYSLFSWNDSGSLEREINFFEEVSKKSNIKYTLVTYGDFKEYTFIKDTNLAVIPIYSIVKFSKFKSFQFLKSLFFPFLIYKNLKHIDIIKQNQLSGSWVSIIFKFLLKKPLFIRTGYDAYIFSIKDKKNILKRFSFKLLTSISLKLSNLYTISSQSDENFIIKNYKFNYNKLKIRQNWVFTEKFSNNTRNSNLNTLVSVGRLENQKNFKYLISQASDLNLSLLIIGEGSLKEELIKLAEKKNVKITIKNNLPYFDLMNLMVKHKFFVISSFYEGNPKVLLEAMSLGLVVFASNIPNHQEIIEHNVNGVLFDISTNDLSYQIDRVTSDVDLQNKLSNGAKKLIKNKFDLQKLVELEVEDCHSLVTKINFK